MFGIDTDSGLADELSERAREAKSHLLGAYAGAIHNTQTMLVMAHDNGRGKIELGTQSIEVNWPQVARQDVFKHVEDNLYKVTKALGGTYIRQSPAVDDPGAKSGDGASFGRLSDGPGSRRRRRQSQVSGV